MILLQSTWIQPKLLQQIKAKDKQQQDN